MPDLAYLAVVAAGAAALWIEAHRQFARPAEDFGSQRYTILSGVQSYQLCTPGEYLRGYMFYVAFYLLIYVALLGSAELRSLLQETAAGQRVAGPQGAPGQGTAVGELLDNTNYGMPIFLSAAIISLLSTGLANRVEIVVRAAAYRLAGIPRGIYRVITEVGNIKYAEIEPDRDLPMQQLFAAGTAGYDPGPLRKGTIAETQDALRVVDLLRQSVVDDYGRKFWASGQVRTLESLINSQRDSVQALEKGAAKLQDSTAPADQATAIDNFHLQALGVRDNLQALFAILFIRGGNSVPTPNGPTAAVIRQLEQAISAPRTADVISSAIIRMVAWTVVAYCFVDIFYQVLRANHWELAGSGAVALDTFFRQFPSALRDAVYWAARFFVFFAIAAGLAVVVQGNRVETSREEPRVSGQFRALRYALASVLPALVASMVLLLIVLGVHVLQFYLDHNALITRRLMAGFLRLNFPFHFTYFFLAALIACCVFYISDNHKKKHWTKLRTVFSALVFSLAYLGISYVGIAVTYGFTVPDPVTGRYPAADYWYVARESAFHVIPAFFFFVSFAWLIEKVEEHRP